MFYPAARGARGSGHGSAAGPLAVHLARHGRISYGEQIPEPLAVEAGVPDVGEGPRAATQATN